MDTNKVLYTFKDKRSSVSTLTLDKFIAEYIHNKYGDVHLWIQNQYNELVFFRTETSRRSVGDSIRHRALILFWSDSESCPDF